MMMLRTFMNSQVGNSRAHHSSVLHNILIFNEIAFEMCEEYQDAPKFQFYMLTLAIMLVFLVGVNSLVFPQEYTN